MTAQHKIILDPTPEGWVAQWFVVERNGAISRVDQHLRTQPCGSPVEAVELLALKARREADTREHLAKMAAAVPSLASTEGLA